MRAAAVIVLGVIGLAACGGSPPPAPETPAADTSSLETGSGADKSSKSSTDEAAPAASSAPAAASAASAASSAPAAATGTDAPAAAFHPAPSATGTIDGKPFAPKVAQVIGPMKKDGRILLSLTEASECPAPGDAKTDHASMTLVVPWSDGYKIDVSALKLEGKKGPGEIGFRHGKKDLSTTFKPSGTVTVVSAPMDKGATGKLKIDLQSGDYMLAGTVDVELCVSPK
jgi:hypothetical protein